MAYCINERLSFQLNNNLLSMRISLTSANVVLQSRYSEYSKIAIDLICIDIGLCNHNMIIRL